MFLSKHVLLYFKWKIKLIYIKYFIWDLIFKILLKIVVTTFSININLFK